MAKIPPEHVGRQQNPIAIRQAKDGDLNEIIRLVQEVVAETYGHLFEEIPPVPIDRPWTRCWVAETEGQIVGIGLAVCDWITDMWVKPQFRSIGVGTVLLDRSEAQVGGDGYATAQLRCKQQRGRFSLLFAVRLARINPLPARKLGFRNDQYDQAFRQERFEIIPVAL